MSKLLNLGCVFAFATSVSVGCGAARNPAPAPAPVATAAATVVVPAGPSGALPQALPASPPPTTAASNPFGLDRAYESCNSFSAHITNASKTAWLDVFVAVESLGLKAGTHDVAVDGKAVSLRITELASPHDGEWSCTDVGGGPMTPVTARWKAVAGTVRVRLHLPSATTTEKPYDGPYDRVDVELVDVSFVDDGGKQRTVSLSVNGLRIGWMPG